MISALKKLFHLLTTRERLGFFTLLGIMLFEGMVEIASLSIVPAYVGIVAYPEKIHTYLPPAITEHLDRRLLLWASVAVVGFFALKLVINTAAVYLRIRYAQNRALRLSHRLFTAYLKAPYAFHLQRNSAELVRNLSSDSTQLASMVLIPLMEMLTLGVIITAVVAGLLFLIPINVLGILLLALAVAALVALAQQKRVRKAGRRAHDYHGRLIRDIHEGLGCAKELKLLGREEYFTRRFQQDFDGHIRNQRLAWVLQKFIPNWVELATITGLAVVVLFLYWQGNDSTSVLSVVTVCAVGLARLKGSLSQFMHNMSYVQQHRSALDVVHSDLTNMETNARQVEAVTTEGPLTFHQGVELKDVWFAYPGAPDFTLRGIDLSIARGEAIGFVGKTGSGKTTLIDIILGLLEPSRGQILIDGRPLATVRHAWQRHIGYVPQMIALIDGSLKENIALGIEPDRIDHQALERAVAQAQLEELVESLPDGLETIIGEQGIRLSGGQRQRVAIARALYHDPEVLVLDEGTSALDSETERAVIQAVENLKGARTLLMIAHRTSTLAGCDRVLRMVSGQMDILTSLDPESVTSPAFTRHAHHDRSLSWP